ncbi:Crp/Fnr family transcriptional regulator [Chromobacterium sphagni]|uniref:Crp/Fnr family transcriptional regulator n=1 Tax=Chromobacterium sphagni TaxID=1903179 RepID=A0A1S1WVA5_9NEIS|nr:Crp/Fnr family transcriptional regulator [Chromobacterium sphagni]OHX11220.1 Crp/Fnr family transcriptional regulator [Chromobacterium sphagni]OHX19200.1 Crp/Fnr family transcriptional regulator [Chromobacterium sphagni]
MTTLIESHRNSILAALPSAEWNRIAPHLDLVEMPAGEALYEAAPESSCIYFPCTAIVSLLHIIKNGNTAEIAVVGNEGIVGISFSMGGETIPGRAVVQRAGYGFKLTSSALKAELNHSGQFMLLLLRYTRALITQMAQTTTCNIDHSLEQRLCRWILTSLDRQQGNELELSEDLISDILGANRQEVINAVMSLQRNGLIRYLGGHLTILKRNSLGERACGCYSAIKTEYEQLLPSSTAK